LMYLLHTRYIEIWRKNNSVSYPKFFRKLTRNTQLFFLA
jgi:hypothetical protein